MSTSKNHFEENQYFTILIAFFGVFIIAFLSMIFFVEGAYTTPTSIIVLCTVFFVILLLFYKLKVTLNANNLKVAFGVGIIKFNYPLNRINLNSVHQMKVPWYIGMGIRYTASGVMVLNTKPGNAVVFSTNPGNRKIAVVVKNTEELEQKLKK